MSFAIFKPVPFLIVIFGAALLQSRCNGRTGNYYISSHGDDNNPGTKSRPFRSLQQLNRVTLHPGDKVFLEGGAVFSGTLSLLLNGDSSRPITITSYDNERENAVIDGGNKEAVVLRGSHFLLKDINIRGAGRKTGNTTNGISLADVSYGKVENIRIRGFQKSGIEIKSCRNTSIRNIYAADNGFAGILITGSMESRSKNILVRDCQAENNPGDPTVLDNHSGNGILAGYADSVLIDHCTATGNGWDMPRTGNGPVGIWAFECSNVVIQYCISYRNRTAEGAKDGGGFDLDGGVTHSVIQYCLSYENEGAGYGLFQYNGASLWYNNAVRYCVSINDAAVTKGAGGLFIWNGAFDSLQLVDCHIYNNVVYSAHAPAVAFEPASLNKNFLFYNNIFIGSGPVVEGPSSGERFAGNIWWKADKNISFGAYKNLNEWARASGQESDNGLVTGRQVDPLLKGPFPAAITDPYQLHLLEGYRFSPETTVRNTGKAFQMQSFIPPVTHDFFGNKVPMGSLPEPGIHEISE